MKKITCSICNEEKTIRQFAKTPSGYRGQCKACLKARRGAGKLTRDEANEKRSVEAKAKRDETENDWKELGGFQKILSIRRAYLIRGISRSRIWTDLPIPFYTKANWNKLGSEVMESSLEALEEYRKLSREDIEKVRIDETQRALWIERLNCDRLDNNKSLAEKEAEREERFKQYEEERVERERKEAMPLFLDTSSWGEDSLALSLPRGFDNFKWDLWVRAAFNPEHLKRLGGYDKIPKFSRAQRMAELDPREYLRDAGYEEISGSQNGFGIPGLKSKWLK